MLVTKSPVLVEYQKALPAWPPGRIAPRSLTDTPNTFAFPRVAIASSSPNVETRIVEGDIEDVDGVLIALGDMPWVTPEVVNKLIDAYTGDGELSIFIPMFGRKRGNPVLWGAEHLPELRALVGDVGGKVIWQRHPASICYVDVESAGVNIDVDTPDALQQLGIEVADE